MKRRIVYTMYIIIAAFVVLAGRLFQLQIIQGEEYRRLSENNCIRLQSIAPLRGKILDRHGEILAENRPAFNLSVIPRDAKPLEETLSRLLKKTHRDRYRDRYRIHVWPFRSRSR